MQAWPDERTIKLLGIDKPIIQAPMAGADSLELAASVSEAGGLGSIACALLSPEEIRVAWQAIRRKTNKPINLNFFCHTQLDKSTEQQKKWKEKLLPYYKELGLDPDRISPSKTRAPFDETFCQIVEELKPEIISFHFGLPSPSLLIRIKKLGSVILSSATTIEEAKWLEKNGCDIIIAQGVEAGGHRGMFLTKDVATQMDLFALVQEIVKIVSVPVVAAGGLADAASIKAALSRGASAVQCGTAYLFCPEAKISPLYRATLKETKAYGTTLTNIFSGKPARGIINRFIQEVGPLSSAVPDFPYASELVAPLRRRSEEMGKIDFMQMWCGKAAHLGREMPAAALTEELSENTLKIL